MKREDAKKYFDAYPNEQVIHITTDGQVFLQANYHDAFNHQRQFTAKNADDKITSIYRKDLDKSEPASELVPTEASSVEDIKAWLKAKGVEVKGNLSKKTLLEKVALATPDATDDPVIPDNTWTEEAIVKWLTDHDEEATIEEGKDDLLARVELIAEELKND